MNMSLLCLYCDELDIELRAKMLQMLGFCFWQAFDKSKHEALPLFSLSENCELPYFMCHLNKQKCGFFFLVVVVSDTIKSYACLHLRFCHYITCLFDILILKIVIHPKLIETDIDHYQLMYATAESLCLVYSLVYCLLVVAMAWIVLDLYHS